MNLLSGVRVDDEIVVRGFGGPGVIRRVEKVTGHRVIDDAGVGWSVKTGRRVGETSKSSLYVTVATDADYLAIARDAMVRSIAEWLRGGSEIPIERLRAVHEEVHRE